MERLTDLYRDPVMGVPHRDRRWRGRAFAALGVGLYCGLLAWSITHPAHPKPQQPSIFIGPPAPHHVLPPASADPEPT